MSAQTPLAAGVAPDPGANRADANGAAPGVTTVTVVAPKIDRPGSTDPTGPNEFILNKSDWADVPTSSNALAMVKNVPGVSYTSSDAYGLDESDASLFVRGFHMNEMAILFEGIPLNDSSFGTLTGTTLLNVGVPDDVSSIVISPGAARENAFSSSSNGGEIRYTLAEPSAKPHFSLSQSFGSHDTLSSTLSDQTGQIGAGGPKALFSLQRVSKDKYEGGGSQYMLRGDLKVVQDVSWGKFSLFLSGSNAQIWGYNDQSFAMLKQFGWKGDYLYPDYRQAYEITLPQNTDKSCGAYTCGQLAALTPYDSGQTSRDLVGALTHQFTLTSRLSGSVMAYRADNTTFASIADPTTPSITGAPFSEEVWHPRLDRSGGSVELQYAAQDHTLKVGYWQERTRSSAGTAWYSEPLLGTGAPLKTIGPYDVYGPAFQTANESRWRTESRQAYMHDDYFASDALTIGAGFKWVDFYTVGGGVGSDMAPYGALKARNPFLPHLSATWSPDKRTDFFADIAESESGYRVSPRGNIGYSASPWTASDQQTFDAVVKTIRPETDWNFTLGGARRLDEASFNYDAYYSLILNRLLSASIGTLYAPVDTVADVATSHIVGVDGGFSIPFLKFFRFYQGASFSRFEYGQYLNLGGDLIAIKGKAQPGYPTYSFVTELSYRAHGADLGLTSTEYLKQPFSYTNDLYGPNYWNVNAHAAYTIAARSPLPRTVVRMDIFNLLNRKNIGTLGVDGFPFSGDLQTMQRAAPRELLFSVSADY